MEQRPKNIIAVRILIIALIAVGIAIVVMMINRQYENRYNKYVDRIDVMYQDSNGIRTTNYVAVLSDGVNWNESEDQGEIAKYVINLARQEANSSDIRNYNIIGQNAEREAVFMYSKSNGAIILYEDGKSTEEIPYE